MRTQVAIIGAGPAGLLLSHLLAARGIDSVVVENRSRAYVEARIRAGVLEQNTVDLLTGAGLGVRLHAEGQRHDGIHLQWPGERRRVDLPGLSGRSVWVYGQTEVVKDLLAARTAAGQPLFFDVDGTTIDGVTTDRPTVRFTDADGVRRLVECDVVAGCDGFHGVSRASIPEPLRTTWERAYPFAWLGILADVAPSVDELVYAWHPDGFALHSMRSPTVSRLYVQVPPDERVEEWSDDRVWEALSTRLALDGWSLRTGAVRDKGITPMRSFVGAPMRHGRLFLAGDAAHTVPPTGAKGMNLAMADVRVLDRALGAYYDAKDAGLLEAYTDTALRRVWRAQWFSFWMTSMLHRFSDATDFDLRRQVAELDTVVHSPSAARTLAENYVGLPLT